MEKDKVLIYYQTYDYNKFRFFDYNRTVGSSRQLCKSIKVVDLTPCVPIIVTQDYYIIDGQNRFKCCKELGLPITYTFYDGDPEKAMIALNTASQIWRQEEWFEYHCAKKRENYLKLKELMDIYPRMNLSNAILLFSQGSTNAGQFKDGKLNDKSELFRQISDFIEKIDVPKDVRAYRPFVGGLLNFFKKHYCETKKIDKLSRKISAITKYSRIEDYVMAFENFVR